MAYIFGQGILPFDLTNFVTEIETFTNIITAPPITAIPEKLVVDVQTEDQTTHQPI